jgi:Raf kinase inhibitor-like YbhB/YbcL family protein
MSTRPDSIDAETAHEYFVEARAQFIDARPADEYRRAAEQIPEAVHIDPGSGVAIDEALRRLPRERLFVVYCDEPNHAASAQIARRARELGLGDASVLEGGFRAWMGAGHPTARTAEGVRGAGPKPRGTPVAPSSGMSLVSSSFADGNKLPESLIGEGGNFSPPLAWAGVPRAARSLVLLMEDLDASASGGEPFTHWIVYDLQPSAGGLELDGDRGGLPPGARRGRNDFGQVEYRGPAFHSDRHRYRFRLFALDRTLDALLPGTPTRTQVLAAMQGHVIAEAGLTCFWERTLESHAGASPP